MKEFWQQKKACHVYYESLLQGCLHPPGNFPLGISGRNFDTFPFGISTANPVAPVTGSVREKNSVHLSRVSYTATTLGRLKTWMGVTGVHVDVDCWKNKRELGIVAEENILMFVTWIVQIYIYISTYLYIHIDPMPGIPGVANPRIISFKRRGQLLLSIFCLEEYLQVFYIFKWS